MVPKSEKNTTIWILGANLEPKRLGEAFLHGFGVIFGQFFGWIFDDLEIFSIIYEIQEPTRIP